MGGEIELEVVYDLAGFFGESVLFHQRHHGALHGSEGCGEMENDTLVASAEILFVVARAEHREEHAVNTDRCLYNVWNIAFVKFGVEIFYVLA